MRARVRLRLDSGEVRQLVSGDIIGRIWGAALRLDDPQISEAHALVSMRGTALKLLALRGRFVVDPGCSYRCGGRRSSFARTRTQGLA